jgi:hypothetical protein
MSRGQQSVLIRFPELSVAEATKAAEELRGSLMRVLGAQATFDIRKENAETQDFGATLVVILGTQAALALAKGVSDYIAKRGNRVVIKTEHGSVIATGDAASNIDVAATTRALETT